MVRGRQSDRPRVFGRLFVSFSFPIWSNDRFMIGLRLPAPRSFASRCCL
jgi:hypothetical protein